VAVQNVCYTFFERIDQYTNCRLFKKIASFHECRFNFIAIFTIVYRHTKPENYSIKKFYVFKMKTMVLFKMYNRIR
jgi:hypothetical protein